MHAFTLAEGHKIALHSYEHPRLTNLSANGLRFQLEGAAALMPDILPVLRAPFGGTNQFVNEQAAAMGFAPDGSQSAGTSDFDPVRTAAQIRDAMVAAFRPGRGMVLHDGPIDTPAGQGVTDAIPMIIDEARARGYCFGVLDESGRVVAGRYTNSQQPIPQITNPVPYIPAAYPGTNPSPWVLVPQPLKVDRHPRTRSLHPRRDRHAHADRHQPDDGHALRRQPDRRDAGTPHRPDAQHRDRRRLDLHRDDDRHVHPPDRPATRPAAPADRHHHERRRQRTRHDRHRAHGSRAAAATCGSTRPATSSAPPRRSRATSAAPSPRRSQLTLGAPATFGPFTAGRNQEYTASTTATITTTAGDAALTYSDPGHLANGTFTLPQPLQVQLSKSAWTAPAANEITTITFKQPIGATDALRTGTYTRTITFTLSTTTP